MKNNQLAIICYLKKVFVQNFFKLAQMLKLFLLFSYLGGVSLDLEGGGGRFLVVLFSSHRKAALGQV